jgi:hypothetical protein
MQTSASTWSSQRVGSTFRVRLPLRDAPAVG